VTPIQFFKWSLPLLSVSLILLIIMLMFVKNTPIPSLPKEDIRISIRPMILTIVVSIFFFFGIFNVVPVYVPAILAILLTIFINKTILLHIDYALLLTFTCFFVFISDIQQIPFIVNEISKAMSNEHLVYLTSILSSQCISNVPSTILIGKFTNYAEALFLGSNIGGFGTLVGSMANMLVFKSFLEHGTISRKKFFCMFSLLQFTGLIVLMILGWLVLYFVI
ncbi:MAG: cation transporter, partial [Lactobacillus iners]|nr:cation transporter [Lactobacillus iners]